MMKIRFIRERRKFLGNAVTLGGLTALVGMIRPAAAGREKSGPQPWRSGLGYRLTDHVKKYYETARR